jgi:hypothetical protein
LQASTLVIAEHDGVSLNPSSLNAVGAACLLGDKSPISILLAGSESSALETVAKQASDIHPRISQVVSFPLVLLRFDILCTGILLCIFGYPKIDPLDLIHLCTADALNMKVSVCIFCSLR